MNNQIKRKIDDKNNQTKKWKFQHQPTDFENLPNEIIYQIFEYLDVYKIYFAFYFYNHRLQNLILNSSFPLRIHIPNISKDDFQQYRNNLIVPNRRQIQYLKISNAFCFEELLSPPRLISDFKQLETLILQQNDVKFLCKTFPHLRKLPNLHSLTISITDTTINPSCLFFPVFCLPNLKTFQLNYPTTDPLCFYGSGGDSIEKLIINSQFRYECLGEFLYGLSNLRYLSIDTLISTGRSGIDPGYNHLKHLKYVNIKLDGVPFHALRFLTEHYFRPVERFYLTIRNVPTVIHAIHWQELIENYMPNLHYFDLNYTDNLTTNSQMFQLLFDAYQAPFYQGKKWTYAYQEGDDCTIIYSTEPYRRKTFTFNWESCQTGQSTIHLNTVRSLKIRGTQVTNSPYYFPNITQLKLENYFQIPNRSIVETLRQLLPLNQLEKLSISDVNFPFYELMNILQLTRRLHTIELKRLVLFPSPTFQTMSQIKSFNLDQICPFDIFKLFLQIFPNLEYLKIGIVTGDLINVIEYLFPKTNHRLRSLCLSEVPQRCVKELKKHHLIKSYSFKLINRQLYLWW